MIPVRKCSLRMRLKGRKQAPDRDRRNRMDRNPRRSVRASNRCPPRLRRSDTGRTLPQSKIRRRRRGCRFARRFFHSPHQRRKSNSRSIRSGQTKAGCRRLARRTCFGLFRPAKRTRPARTGSWIRSGSCTTPNRGAAGTRSRCRTGAPHAIVQTHPGVHPQAFPTQPSFPCRFPRFRSRNPRSAHGRGSPAPTRIRVS